MIPDVSDSAMCMAQLAEFSTLCWKLNAQMHAFLACVCFLKSFIHTFDIQEAEEKLKVSNFTYVNFRKIWEFLPWELAPVL